MGYLQEPPPIYEYAEARETIVAALNPIDRAELMAISHNLKVNGTVSQQEAFKLQVSEIDGIVIRDKKAIPKAVSELRSKILDNPAYGPFKTFTAKDQDPLLPR